MGPGPLSIGEQFRRGRIARRHYRKVEHAEDERGNDRCRYDLDLPTRAEKQLMKRQLRRMPDDLRPNAEQRMR
jgi:hypothetical protein